MIWFAICATGYSAAVAFAVCIFAGSTKRERIERAMSRRDGEA